VKAKVEELKVLCARHAKIEKLMELEALQFRKMDTKARVGSLEVALSAAIARNNQLDFCYQ